AARDVQGISKTASGSKSQDFNFLRSDGVNNPFRRKYCACDSNIGGSLGSTSSHDVGSPDWKLGTSAKPASHAVEPGPLRWCLGSGNLPSKKSPATFRQKFEVRHASTSTSVEFRGTEEPRQLGLPPGVAPTAVSNCRNDHSGLRA